jgi:hypothetical protein
MNDSAQKKPPTSHVPSFKSRVSHDASPHTGHEVESDWTNDARNPLSWSPTRRWTIIVVLAMTNFVAYVVSHTCEISVVFNHTTGP